MSTTQMIETLWQAARPHLTDEQLASLDHFDSISGQLTDIAQVMEGIGCLVAEDGNRSPSRAGNFQTSNDVPTLLFTLAKAIDTAAAAVFISSEAEFILRERKEQAVKIVPVKSRKRTRSLARKVSA